ncbi:hypothetical protein F511_40857 [Dorcoceras hygrometricum]|uniref:Uncharacterized protein n=1 Tax=Dorcoceras hygrometricum TaxID=472368 RepID=A0A2Z7C5Y3_9LAMI|nr:hypothetical protein F511_40857 [Dorcoceras hygrometricum]
MGTQTQQDKAGNKYEVKPQYEELSKQLGGRHSNPVVTTPTIALDFQVRLGHHSDDSVGLSGATQQSTSHNVVPNQKLKLLNSAVSRFRSSSTQPPRLVGKESSSQVVSNATKNSKNGGRNQRQITIESEGNEQLRAGGK